MANCERKDHQKKIILKGNILNAATFLGLAKLEEYIINYETSKYRTYTVGRPLSLDIL